MESSRKQINLNINETKKEDIIVEKNRSDEWKTCQYVEIMLDTNERHKWKGRAICTYNKIKSILKHKTANHLSEDESI